MAFLKEIRSKLKAKHPGLSARALDAVAKRLEIKVSAESEIDSVIEDFDNGPIGTAGLAEIIQQEGDHRVTQHQQQNPTPAPQPPAPPTPTPTPTQAPAAPATGGLPQDAPEWAKALFGSLSNEINNLKSADGKKTLKEKALAKLADAKIPAKFYSDIEKEEDIEDMITNARKEYDEVLAFSKGTVLGTQTPPAGPATPEAQALDAGIAAWQKSKVPPAPAK